MIIENTKMGFRLLLNLQLNSSQRGILARLCSNNSSSHGYRCNMADILYYNARIVWIHKGFESGYRKLM